MSQALTLLGFSPRYAISMKGDTPGCGDVLLGLRYHYKGNTLIYGNNL
jgi:hypothetical protein